MKIINAIDSVLSSDKFKMQAAEVLVATIQNQQISYIGNSSGEVAAEYCADFIETLSKRLKKMALSQS